MILWIRHLNWTQWGWLDFVPCGVSWAHSTSLGWVGRSRWFYSPVWGFAVGYELRYLNSPHAASLSSRISRLLYIPREKRQKLQGLLRPILWNSHKIGSAVFCWSKQVTRAATDSQGLGKLHLSQGGAAVLYCKGMWIQRGMVHWGPLL